MSDRFEMRQAQPQRKGTSKKPPKVREEPRITVHALADYLTAGANRRRTILTEQKRPRSFQTTYYREAEDAIVKCLASGGQEGSLDAAVRELRAIKPRNEWEQSRCESGVAALEAFRGWLTSGKLDLEEFQPAPHQPKPLVVGRVTISVRPDLLLFASDGQPIGCAKLYLKAVPLTDARAKYAGALLHQYVQDVLGGSRVDPRLCKILDVHARRVLTAPRTFSRPRKDVVAACSEIAALWPSL